MRGAAYRELHAASRSAAVGRRTASHMGLLVEITDVAVRGVLFAALVKAHPFASNTAFAPGFVS